MPTLGGVPRNEQIFSLIPSPSPEVKGAFRRLFFVHLSIQFYYVALRKINQDDKEKPTKLELWKRLTFRVPTLGGVPRNETSFILIPVLLCSLLDTRLILRRTRSDKEEPITFNTRKISTA